MDSQDTTRHGVLADDSVRVSLILPKHVKGQVDELAVEKNQTASDVMRECIAKGVGKCVHR